MWGYICKIDMHRTTMLGSKRLKHVHSFVSVINTPHNSVGGGYPDVGELCNFCSHRLNFLKTKTASEVRNIYTSCSGHGWVCQLKNELLCIQVVEWDRSVLMKKSDYKNIIKHVISNFTPTIAILAIDYFNRRLVADQPHMQKIVQVAEHCLYLNYRRFEIKEQTAFPVPVPGREKEDNFVPFWVRDSTDPDVDAEGCGFTSATHNPCQQSEWSVFLDQDISRGGLDVPFHSEVLDKIRLLDLVEAENRDLISNIDALTTAPDPCKYCCEIKKYYPGRSVTCTGSKPLCTFKEEFFSAWPADLKDPSKCTFVVLSCNTLSRYESLMDTVFSLKYFERSMCVKAHLDTEIIGVNPHMSKICSLYDLLLYRYYGHGCFRPEIEIEFQEESGGEEEEGDEGGRESDLVSDSGLSGIDEREEEPFF